MIHYFDPSIGVWQTLGADANREDIAVMLAATASNRPCESCDADVSYDYLGDGPPVIVIAHSDDCPNAA